ncbi:MAG: hypothetical protein ACF8XB_06520 [Planctomycetota bacterium JB042]
MGDPRDDAPLRGERDEPPGRWLGRIVGFGFLGLVAGLALFKGEPVGRGAQVVLLGLAAGGLLLGLGRRAAVPFLLGGVAMLGIRCGAESGMRDLVWLEPIPFDAEAWRRAADDPYRPRTRRQRMARDLLRTGRLVGLSRAEVIDLLGPPDPVSEYLGRPSWTLGPELGLISIDSESLAVDLDDDGRVVRAHLWTD